MADLTDNRSYPYPECDPPRVKDRSDIRDLMKLAVAVDNDATAMETRLIDLLEEPDSAGMSYSGTITFSNPAFGQAALVPYNTVLWDNQGGRTDTVAGALRPQERGWYLITTSIRCTDNTNTLMVRHLKNGRSFEEGRRLEGHAIAVVGTQVAITTADVLLCQVGDVIQSQVRSFGVPGTFTFDSRIGMAQLIKLDI